MILIAVAWVISLFLAFLPLSPQLKYVFTDRAIILDNLFFANVTVRLDAAKDWSEKLLTFNPQLQSAPAEMVYKIRNAISWSELYAALENVTAARMLNVQRFIG